jgi:hypothetical protein
MAVAPNAVAGVVERPPPNLPIGVRAADRMKTSLMESWYRGGDDFPSTVVCAPGS